MSVSSVFEHCGSFEILSSIHHCQLYPEAKTKNSVWSAWVEISEWVCLNSFGASEKYALDVFQLLFF